MTAGYINFIKRFVETPDCVFVRHYLAVCLLFILFFQLKCSKTAIQSKGLVAGGRGDQWIREIPSENSHLTSASRLTKVCKCQFEAHGSYPAHGTIVSSSWFEFQETILQMLTPDKIVQCEKGDSFSKNQIVLLPSVASKSTVALHHQICLLSSG